MRASPEIRELARAELELLLVLYAHLHPDDDPLPPRASLEQIWSELVDDPRQIYVGCFVGGTLASSCNAAIIPNLTRGARPYAVIENVVTHPDFRRQGLASATLEHLLAKCWKHDCYKIMLQSAAGRDTAHRLYEKLGFDPDAKQAFVLKRN
ncbi:MAG: GNAT family N-acetyltransferase [Myxococcales bacterium]|jgi:GNAT superfamily N-acetyltransferase